MEHKNTFRKWDGIVILWLGGEYRTHTTSWWGKYRLWFENTGWILWLAEKEKHRNRMGIIVEKNLKENVVDVELASFPKPVFCSQIRIKWKLIRNHVSHNVSENSFWEKNPKKARFRKPKRKQFSVLFSFFQFYSLPFSETWENTVSQKIKTKKETENWEGKFKTKTHVQDEPNEP